MSYDSWKTGGETAGLTDYDLREEYMERQREKERDEQSDRTVELLESVFNRRGALFVCAAISDYHGPGTLTPSPEAGVVCTAVRDLGLPHVLSLLGQWSSTQKGRGAA